MLRVLFLMNALASWSLLYAEYNADYYSYIDRYKSIAISEMERAGVPASIKMAQALLESNAGKSTLAQKANNHFGIKCGNNWHGKKYHKEDDDYDEYGKLIKSCFREYKHAEESYIGHSEFLRANEMRYGFLFRYDPRDYKRWAYGLKQAGYATSANYAEKLISIIEAYQLYQLDTKTAVDILTSSPLNTSLIGVLINNDVKMVLAKGGETPAVIARRTETSVKRILKYNEELNNPNQALQEKTRVYIQPKRAAYREKQKYHYVKAGEDMYDISQMYGVKLKSLYHRNRLPEGTQPAEGERIKLRGWKVKGNEIPRLRSQVPPTVPPPPTTTTPDPNRPGELELQEDDGDDTAPFKSDPEDFTPEFPPAIKPDTTTNPPVPVTPPAPVITNGGIHTVQKGDTLYNIARRYGMTVDKLMQINNLNDSNIKVGQQLKVK